MSLSKQKSTEDLTKCSICHSIMNDPKALPCLHTYCRLCIQEWAKKGEEPSVVSCPICREKTQLPSGGVAELKSNFFVTTLKDRKLAKKKLKEKTMKCTSCGRSGEEVVAYCRDCKDYLCGKCKESHAIMRILKDHQVIPVEEVQF